MIGQIIVALFIAAWFYFWYILVTELTKACVYVWRNRKSWPRRNKGPQDPTHGWGPF